MTVSRRAFCKIAGGGLAIGLSAAQSQAGMPKPPTGRIAALEQRIVETLLAIGIGPMAMQDPDSYRRWVVEPQLPADIRDLGTEAEPNAEYLADLRPDLILMPEERPDLYRLAMLAPVWRLRMTPSAGVSEYAHFKDLLLKTGSLFDRDGTAERAVTAVETDIAEARSVLAAKAHRPVLLVTFVDDRHVWIYGRSNLFQHVLDQVGIENAWRRESLFDVVGIEQLAAHGDARLIFIENNLPGVPEGLARNPLWRSLPFVRHGHINGIASVTPFGAFPTAGRFARLLAGAVEVF